MKLLVFAHVPPPYHGQSYGVQRMLAAFGGNRRRQTPAAPNAFGIECYHVNARVSRNLEDVGEFRGAKIFLTLLYCLQAVWCRFRYGVENFYYVPAPGKAVALYRDWLVMFICRPFFKRIILHWHAAGLARWLETTVSIRVRGLTYRRMKNADLSIVLAEFNRRDAEKLTAQRVAVVPAGVPDPCPQFETELLPRRRARAAALKRMLAGDFGGVADTDKVVKVLFLAHCTREKGVFDSMVGVMLANEKLAAEKSPLRFRLTLVGAFAADAEEKELHESVRRHGLERAVEILGFVSEERKEQALREADLFCFPTYFHAESFGAVLVEAMAFGLPIVTTRWRSIPEIFPPDYPGLVDPKSPGQVADALRRLAGMDLAGPLREIFLRRFTFERHIAGMATAIRSVE
jgi:glycosyltransferase involved in cell wall biosynthesis